MKSKIKLLLLFLLVTGPLVHASNKKEVSDTLLKKNNVFVELLGNGLVYSLNYERKFQTEKGNIFAGRIGFSYQPKCEDILAFYGPRVLTEIVQLKGNSKHFFEYGGGVGYYFQHDYDNESYNSFYSESNKNETFHLLTINARIGYRYENQRRNYNFRVGFVPMYGFAFGVGDEDYKSAVFPWIGISFGKNF